MKMCRILIKLLCRLKGKCDRGKLFNDYTYLIYVITFVILHITYCMAPNFHGRNISYKTLYVNKLNFQNKMFVN